ncbi:Rne/Rng family ribonuclease [Streptomyces sp. NPDC050619]|uniref:Rne/Rng family ribonuclease n=1 Tax=Streptomyces sp. NPDC050619 TaxID=3157214 RepID=UPI0034218473
MLEPTEPTEGSDLNTPSDTLPPRRRRRAASRPAGPPVGSSETPAETVAPAIPAAEAEDLGTEEIDIDKDVEGTESAGSVEAAEAITETAPAAEAAPAGRPRRRASRRVSAPAGAATSVEAAETVVPATPAVEPVAQVSEPVAEAAEDAAPPRTRRRATRRVSAPADVTETAEAAQAVETAESAGEAVDLPTGTAAATATAAVTAEQPAPDEEADGAAPRRTRRRASRRVSAPAAAPEAAEAAAVASTTEPEAPAALKDEPTESAENAEAPAEDAAPRRARRRSVRKAATGFAAPAQSAKAEAAAPAEDTETDEDEAPRQPARPAVAVFQAPVFTEPRFQTPERAAAEAAAETDGEAPEETERFSEEPAEEQGGARRRRRRRGAGQEPEAQAAAAETAVAEEDEPEGSAEDVTEGDEAEESGSRRRRRRGGRRRRRGESADSESGEGQESYGDDLAAAQAAQDAEDTAEQAEEDAEAEDDTDDREESGGSGSASSRRRRRRRRRSGDTSADIEPGDGDPERTVVKVREPRPKAEPSDEVQSIKGSTRLEAKKQRRREGREQGRRRVPIITEAEFLARREAVERVMVVRQHGDRTQIGVLEDGVLVEHYVNKEQSTSYVGNVYLGKVQNVLPSMEAAFIDIGKGRNAVLYAGEVNFEALGMANGPRRIESALKSGQPVLVQVTKDPIGHKGARLTSQVSLPGRYLVYVPEGSMTGISRKLPDTERARLKTILKKIVPEDAGVIVRTAAEGASEDELRRDVERLQGQWEDIQKKSKNGGSSNAPTLLYGEPDMTVRVVRDIFNEDFTKVVVSGDEAWETIHGYVAHVAPDLADRLSRWTSEVDVFATYRIDEQLAKALDRKVWLPSGGSLVIDRTEAMVVVDVNTGKFTGQGGNLEETVTRNNLEAAEEIVRQLRLRDLGGIIVIDFIDMVLESNRDLVLRRLLECLGRDRTKHQVAEVTSLGLVQMTRKRVGQGLLESFSETCVHCNGRGVIVHMEQPTAAGGGGKRRKRGRGGDGQVPEHEAVAVVEAPEVFEEEPEAEVAAEVAEPVALTEPHAAEPLEAFVPDEELYSSVAEAEAAAGRGRSRRRASRRVSAPAGAPRRESRREQSRAEAPTAQDATAEEEVRRPVQPEAAAVAHAEPVAAEDPVVEAPVVEAAAEAPVAEEAAPKGRGRRRATRKVSAPAGSPAGAEAAVVTVTETAPQAEEAPAPVTPVTPVAPVEQEPAEAPAESAAPARPRRRAVRKATAPTASEETAVVVVPAAEQAPAVPEESGEEAAPAKKAARKTAKKATAKKAAAKKTVAKKTAAKKTAAKKTTAKKAAKTTKTAAKSTSKTVAAERTQPSVSASTDED